MFGYVKIFSYFCMKVNQQPSLLLKRKVQRLFLKGSTLQADGSGNRGILIFLLK